tara:strand:+ start:238 stop:381 length:144 start_codon:yes stop_codon:yes gene_type:complete
MIQNIIELLQIAKGETDNIRIAQGKDALPKDLKSASKIIKNTTRWQK